MSAFTGGLPKQYWAFGNGPTLIEETARRIAPLAPVRRRVTVVDRSHEPYVTALRRRRALGQVLYQSSDRGTAAGVLLGLTPVLSEDPAAIVLITPADHGVARADHFQRGIRSARALVRSGAHDIVLFGMEPTAPTGDYGWITPAPDARGSADRCVAAGRFVEKPGEAEAKRLYGAGAVWNTMVLVGRASAVFAECERQTPELAEVFLAARREPDSNRDQFLAACYPTLPRVDFSRDVIARARGLALYTWPVAMGWSDLGTPERVRTWQSGPAPEEIQPREGGSLDMPLPGIA